MSINSNQSIKNDIENSIDTIALRKDIDSTKGRICVLVLGDFGRSPRMQYHALSLAKEGYSVDVVVYGGSRPTDEILVNDNITIHNIKPPPSFNKVSFLPQTCSYILKALWQTMSLMSTLLCIHRPLAILVQNPPSIPALPVSWFVSRVKRCDLIVDWHNYGHSILALNLGASHFLVKVSKMIEEKFGGRANVNLCVTEAMKSDIWKNWKISPTVLYDRPAFLLRPLPVLDRHILFMRLKKHYPVLDTIAPDTNLMTERFADGNIYLRIDRPGLIVSSTSWTKDENFDLLLDALEFYNEQRDRDSNKYPPLLVIITGKGPLKGSLRVFDNAQRLAKCQSLDCMVSIRRLPEVTC